MLQKQLFSHHLLRMSAKKESLHPNHHREQAQRNIWILLRVFLSCDEYNRTDFLPIQKSNRRNSNAISGRKRQKASTLSRIRFVFPYIQRANRIWSFFSSVRPVFFGTGLASHT